MPKLIKTVCKNILMPFLPQSNRNFLEYSETIKASPFTQLNTQLQIKNTKNLSQNTTMFFGFDPFAMLGINQQPRQQQQRPPNRPNQGENIFNTVADFLNGGFMNPVAPNHQQQNQRNQPNEQRPRYYRPKKNEEPKQKQKEQPIYNENTGQYWKNKGNECFKKGDYQGALKMYDRAIELNNTESVFFSNRAKVLKKINKLEQALQDAQISVQLDTANIKGHLICGQVLAQLGKRKNDPRKVQNALTRLTKAYTLCGNQNKQQFEKQLTVYIYRAKKLLWYMKFNQIRTERIQTINEYKKYLETDKDLTQEEKDRKLQQFMNSINQNVVFQIPDHLICNITLDLMEDPVTTESGHTYERTAIEEHIERNGKTDPFTRKPISSKLYPSISIKKAIEDFLQKNPWAYQFSQGQTMDDIQF